MDFFDLLEQYWSVIGGYSILSLYSHVILLNNLLHPLSDILSPVSIIAKGITWITLNVYATLTVLRIQGFKLDHFTNQLSVLEAQSFSEFPSTQLSPDKTKFVCFLQNKFKLKIYSFFSINFTSYQTTAPWLWKFQFDCREWCFRRFKESRVRIFLFQLSKTWFTSLTYQILIQNSLKQQKWSVLPK